MQFEAHIPHELGEEANMYASAAVINSEGFDIDHFGETISVSFEGIDVCDIALAVMEDDFKHTGAQVDQIIRLGGFTIDSLEDMAYSYMKAAQILRQQGSTAVSLESAA
jgi:hypothetical protein